MANRTKNKSSSHLSNYIGPGKDLVPSELPTVRDILRHRLLRREPKASYGGEPVGRDDGDRLAGELAES